MTFHSTQYIQFTSVHTAPVSAYPITPCDPIHYNMRRPQWPPRQCKFSSRVIIFYSIVILCMFLLHFAWVVDDAKCIVVTRVCVSVCLSAAARPHYCTDPDVTWRSGRGCPLVVHYWADLHSGHGLRWCGNIMRTRNISRYMLVLALCLVLICAAVWRNKSS